MKTNKELYKEAFSSVNATEEFKEELMKIPASQKVIHSPIKKITFTLIAAVITLTLLVSTTYATGGFRSAYGYLFSGECVGNMYKGGNPTVTCDNPNFNVELLGVTGASQYDCIIAYRISKADGSTFVEADDSQEIRCQLYDESNVSTSFFSKEGTGVGETGAIYAHLSNDKTEIYAYDHFTRSGARLLGNTYKCKLDGLKIGVCEEKPDGDYTKMSDKEKKKLYEKYEKLGLDAVPDYETGEISVYRVTEYNFKAKLSVDLNYKYDNIDLEPEAEVKCVKTSEGSTMGLRFDDYEISCYNLRVRGHHTDDPKGYDERNYPNNTLETYTDDIMPEGAVVTMKDGSKIELLSMGYSIHEDCFEQTYATLDIDKQQLVFMDINEIQSVSYGSLTLTP